MLSMSLGELRRELWSNRSLMRRLMRWRQRKRVLLLAAASGFPSGKVGDLRLNRIAGEPRSVVVRANAPAEVARHEIGHLLDEVAGQISSDGLSKERAGFST